MNHNDNDKIVLNDLTAVRVTVGKGGVYGMTKREGYENPTVVLSFGCHGNPNNGDF